MGGPGSGGWGRVATRQGTDLLSRMSIAMLRQAVGLRYPGNVGRIGWRFRGAVTAFRVIYDSDDQGEYVCMVSESCGGRIVDQHIRLTSTPCNFGGRRLWLQCPKCDRRIGVLNLTAHGWFCGRCAKIRYSSQLEDRTARLVRRRRKIRRRLNASENLLVPLEFIKPKGMHWETYIELFATEYRLRAAWLGAVAAYLNPRGQAAAGRKTVVSER